jgi:hypothetical protein
LLDVAKQDKIRRSQSGCIGGMRGFHHVIFVQERQKDSCPMRVRTIGMDD